MSVLIREIPLSDLEVREDTDGRTLDGLCVPYDRIAEIPGEGIREVFRYGAFKAQTRAPWRLALYDGHKEDTDHKIGLCRELIERAEGLYARFRLLASRAEIVRDLVEEGNSCLSVGFAPLGYSPVVEGVTERRRAHLAHVALVGKGAFPGAEVLALRELEPEPTHPDTEFWSEIDRWSLDRKRA